MERARAYRNRARSMTVAEFTRMAPQYFLVKLPTRSRREDPRSRPSWDCDFATGAIPVGGDPHADSLDLAPVRKRPGNPFPERITVGRASNCDVVWRYPFVSKVHAHLIAGAGGGLNVQDRGAANFTLVNGRRLEAHETAKLEVGDVLRLGSLDLVLYTAEGLHAMLSEGPQQNRLGDP